jgi:hypothetical protein
MQLFAANVNMTKKNSRIRNVLTNLGISFNGSLFLDPNAVFLACTEILVRFFSGKTVVYKNVHLCAYVHTFVSGRKIAKPDWFKVYLMAGKVQSFGPEQI